MFWPAGAAHAAKKESERVAALGALTLIRCIHKQTLSQIVNAPLVGEFGQANFVQVLPDTTNVTEGQSFLDLKSGSTVTFLCAICEHLRGGKFFIFIAIKLGSSGGYFSRYRSSVVPSESCLINFKAGIVF